MKDLQDLINARADDALMLEIRKSLSDFCSRYVQGGTTRVTLRGQAQSLEYVTVEVPLTVVVEKIVAAVFAAFQASARQRASQEFMEMAENFIKKGKA